MPEDAQDHNHLDAIALQRASAVLDIVIHWCHTFCWRHQQCY